jgi:hypothetical protein
MVSRAGVLGVLSCAYDRNHFIGFHSTSGIFSTFSKKIQILVPWEFAIDFDRSFLNCTKKKQRIDSGLAYERR